MNIDELFNQNIGEEKPLKMSITDFVNKTSFGLGWQVKHINQMKLKSGWMLKKITTNGSQINTVRL